jgi:hypothetical protein
MLEHMYEVPGSDITTLEITAEHVQAHFPESTLSQDKGSVA